MRILYDGTIYKLQTAGGINRYFSHLIEGLPKSYYPIVTTTGCSEISQPQHPNLKLIYYHRFGLPPNRLSYFLEPYFFRWFTDLKKVDLLHPTYYQNLNQQDFQLFRMPLVITVHDMIHELFQPTVDPNLKQIAAKKSAIFAANAIICVSENTKKDLIKIYPQVREKIKVIPLASSLDQSLVTPDLTLPPQPYYLYVGGRWIYKNFDGLLKAFAQITKRHHDVSLCVVGESFSPTELKEINTLGISDRIYSYHSLNNHQLASLYHGSLALVYPSQYEGFGLPPLEAMSCATAVLATNTSSIPEVTGDAALLLNPNEVSEWVDGMLWLLHHPIERDRLIAKGKKRAQQFSWEKTVNQTVAVYQSLV
ncbi:glycosyltransferase family 4 protein [Spirulina subsalsa FACHB-351]|uniref:Glycosyltransferase family 4 protein n=1 Tax=Spirulina subsalsa FACHB-351 TaxID=234711 RepID=A0ABT3L625_9CYAN|nr:glycosyltransferase family 1 protein [Spirulina subsalsa]MCW6036951.1 glycosyltransferase family 4 protein [Spirulina subsalsa FACHB-351]